MRKGGGLISRLLEAVVISFAFFSLMLCLTRLPEVVQGPLGYGKATPSWAVRILIKLSPTEWFPFATAPVVFWIYFRRGANESISAAQLVVWLALYCGGLGALVLGELLAIHGAYAVERPSPPSVTVISNVVMLLLLVGLALRRELRQSADSGTCKGE